MHEPKLLSPFHVGAVAVSNRIVMAPMSRHRAREPGDVPCEMHAAYYAQRASAGLIISEGLQISPASKGYARTPGIFAAPQIAGWRNVTDAVHAGGGKIAAQLWHVGRVSHISFQPNGGPPLAPSALASRSHVFHEDGYLPTSHPRVIDENEIRNTIDDYARAASNAREAGFDAVEVHAANGYLIDQFVRDSSNVRKDRYGGPVENRLRFLFEVTDAVVAAIGAERVGVRLSPFASINGHGHDATPMVTYGMAIDGLSARSIAYLHMIEGETGKSRDLASDEAVAVLRRRFSGPYIANNGYTRQSAIAAVETGHADLVAFGRPFIANPDLVERLRDDAPLNSADRATYYGGGVHGYLDYPALRPGDGSRRGSA